MLIQIDSNAKIGCTNALKHSTCPANDGHFCSGCPLLTIVNRYNGKKQKRNEKTDKEK